MLCWISHGPWVCFLLFAWKFMSLEAAIPFSYYFGYASYPRKLPIHNEICYCNEANEVDNATKLVPFKSCSFSGKFCPGIYTDCVITNFDSARICSKKENNKMNIKQISKNRQITIICSWDELTNFLCQLIHIYLEQTYDLLVNLFHSFATVIT